MVDVLACISASPERFAQVEIRDNNNFENIIRHYECAGFDIGYQLSLDSDEYDYKKIILVGPIDYINGIKEKIEMYIPDAKIVL